MVGSACTVSALVSFPRSEWVIRKGRTGPNSTECIRILTDGPLFPSDIVRELSKRGIAGLDGGMETRDRSGLSHSVILPR